MEIEQAKAFVSRMSRTGEIPSGLSIALDTTFLKLDEQAAELKRVNQEIETMKAHPIHRIQLRPTHGTEEASVRLLNQLTSSGLGLGAKF